MVPLIVKSNEDDLVRLCDEHDVAWRNYIKAARNLRARLSVARLSEADRMMEQRAWEKVCGMRTRLDKFISDHGEAPSSDRKSAWYPNAIGVGAGRRCQLRSADKRAGA
jgi:hypothetical protein